MEKMTERINKFLYQHECSFRKIIKLIMAEAVNNDDRRGFLVAMDRFNKLNYKFEEGEEWKKKREGVEANLFR